MGEHIGDLIDRVYDQERDRRMMEGVENMVIEAVETGFDCPVCSCPNEKLEFYDTNEAGTGGWYRCPECGRNTIWKTLKAESATDVLSMFADPEVLAKYQAKKQARFDQIAQAEQDIKVLLCTFMNVKCEAVERYVGLNTKDGFPQYFTDADIDAIFDFNRVQLWKIAHLFESSRNDIWSCPFCLAFSTQISHETKVVSKNCTRCTYAATHKPCMEHDSTYGKIQDIIGVPILVILEEMDVIPELAKITSAIRRKLTEM